MRRACLLVCVALLALGAVADQYDALLPERARQWPRQFLDSLSEPDALAGGNVYIVTNDVSYAGGPGESALRVAEGASVCVLICEGASLTCRGVDGRAAAVGGAGIEVPSGSTGSTNNTSALRKRKASGGDETVFYEFHAKPDGTDGVMVVRYVQPVGGLGQGLFRVPRVGDRILVIRYLPTGSSVERHRAGKLTEDVPLYAVGRLVAETGIGRLI